LLLDEEEAVAIVVGLRTSASVGIAGIEETSVRALAKLERLMPSQLRRRINALGAALVTYPGYGPAVDPETLTVIAAACRDEERLRFRYLDYKSTPTRRIVEPHRLVHTGRRWYLVAYDLDREGWRTFRVDRIEAQPKADRRFTPRNPPATDIAAYVSQAVSLTRDRYQARVILHAPIQQLINRVPKTVGTLQAIDEHTTLLNTASDWIGGLAIYIANIGVDFEVLDPPELIDEVRELAKRFARASGQAGIENQ
jgi:predicted DNA-binding transcriptional regulator YafY